MRRVAISAILILVATGCGDEGANEDPVVCTAGQLACSQDETAVVQCKQDETGFDPVETCQQGSTCIDARCQCPGGQVQGAEACRVPGVTECSDWFAMTPSGCTVTPASCGAGEIFAGNGCTAVGVATCPEGFLLDPNGTGCLVDELPCTEGKEWFIKDGCINPGLALSCGNVANPWPADVPEGTVLYVSETGGAPDADGTQQKPFKQIQDAVDAAAEGTAILVGSGTYEGGIEITKPVRIIGKCAQYVTIQGGKPFAPEGEDFPGDFALFASVEGGTIEVAGVTVLDPSIEAEGKSAGFFFEGADDVSVHDVLFDGLTGAAVDVREAAAASVASIHVKNTSVLVAELGPYGQTAYGARLANVGAASVTDSRFESTQGADIDASGTCPLVSHNHFEKRGKLGGLPPVGVRVAGCLAGETVIDANRFIAKMTHAIFVDGGQVKVTRNWIQGTVTDYDDISGPAVRLLNASAAVTGNYLKDNQMAGVALKACTGDVTGNRVEGGLPSDPGLKGGDGIVLVDCDPGPVVVSGNSVVANTRNGILATGSIAKIQGNLVLNTAESPSGNITYGAGVHVVEGADAVVTGNSISGNALAGVRIDKAFGKVQDNAIAGTVGSAAGDGRCGGGVVAIDSALPDGILGNLVSGNYNAGVLLSGSTAGAISNNIVEQSKGAGGSLGVGIVLAASKALVSDNWVRANKDVGLLYDASSGDVARNVFDGNGSSGAGVGALVQNVEKPLASVSGNSFATNGFAGLVAVAASIEVSGNTFATNVANKEGLAGAGVWIEDCPEAEVSLNKAAGNLLAGIVATGAMTDVAVKSNLASSSAKGFLPGKKTPVQMSDGIAVMAGAFASVVNNRCESNSMAGVVFLDGEGVASGNELNDNGTFGLELSSSSISEDPDLEPNHFRGNKSGKEMKQSDRPVPEYVHGAAAACSDL